MMIKSSVNFPEKMCMIFDNPPQFAIFSNPALQFQTVFTFRYWALLIPVWPCVLLLFLYTVVSLQTIIRCPDFNDPRVYKGLIFSFVIVYDFTNLCILCFVQI